MTAPAAPNMYSEAGYQRTVVLTWAAVSGATAYKVYQDSTTAPTTLVATVTVAQPDGSFRWESAAFNPGDRRYFRIKASNAVPELSAFSNERDYGFPSQALNVHR